MNKDKLIIANWKMNFFYKNASIFCKKLISKKNINCKFIICPPFPLILPLSSKYKKIDFYARSIFLQGLLLHDTSNLPNFFLPIKKKLEKMVKYCKKKDISQLEACINFIKEQKNINYFILGIDNHEQLEQIIHIFKKKKNSNINFSKFSINNSKFIDPRNWKL